VAERVVPEIDASVPHPARVYDYWLGGKDNFPVDRELAERIIEVLPTITMICRANRAFMVRAARFLAAEAGITQFLDIGTGLPTSPNLPRRGAAGRPLPVPLRRAPADDGRVDRGVTIAR